MLNLYCFVSLYLNYFIAFYFITLYLSVKLLTHILTQNIN